jgi:hypothetical protein
VSRTVSGEHTPAPLADWRCADKYPPIDAPVCVFAWEFIRRNQDVRSGAHVRMIGEFELDPALSYWKLTHNKCIQVDARIFAFDNTLFPSHAKKGQTLGTAQPGHLHVDLDIREPLAEQLRRIGILAKIEQRRSVQKGHSKLQQKKLVQYLRILDAKAAKASSLKIATVLKISPDAVKDGLAKAIELRDGGWREIQRTKPSVEGISKRDSPAIVE